MMQPASRRHSALKLFALFALFALLCTAPCAAALVAAAPAQAATTPALSAGATHVLALENDGSLWTWGANANGRTGLGVTAGNTTQPTQVGAVTTWSTISAGASESLATRSDGTLWAWGSNTNGQTGQGLTIGNTTTPTQVGTATNWQSVAAGTNYSLALRTDGTLWAWGQNANGQTGLGVTTGNTLAPTQVGTITTWSAITAGPGYALALRSNGTLWAWGSNANGQTGQGVTTGTRTTPTQVGTATNWTSVEAGTSFALALRSDGTLWAWGSNSNGETGLGLTIGNTTTPTQVGTATTWSAIDAGSNFAVALGAGGAYSWGSNTQGQLGLGSTGGTHSTPSAISGSANWAIIVAGTQLALASASDGVVSGWGLNSSGQLGLGNTTSPITSPAGLPAYFNLLPIRPMNSLIFTNDTPSFSGAVDPLAVGNNTVSWTVTLSVTSNAAHGYSLQASDNANGLYKSTAPTASIPDVSGTAAGPGTAPGSFPSAGFGVSATASGGTLANGFTNPAAGSFVQYPHYPISPATFMSNAGPTATTDTLSLTNKVTVDLSVAGGTYTDTITYLATPNY